MNRKTQGFLALGLTLVGLLCIFLCLIYSFRRQEGARTNVVDTTRLDTCQFGAPKPEDGDVLTCQFGTLPTGYLAPTVQNGVPNPPVFKYTQSDDGTLELHQYVTIDSLPNQKSKERNCTGLTHSKQGYPQPVSGDNLYCVSGTEPTNTNSTWSLPNAYFNFNGNTLNQYASTAAMKSYGIDPPTLRAKDCRNFTQLGNPRIYQGISSGQTVTCATNSPDSKTTTLWSFEPPNLLHPIELTPEKYPDVLKYNIYPNHRNPRSIPDCQGFKQDKGVFAADGQTLQCMGDALRGTNKDNIFTFKTQFPDNSNPVKNNFVNIGNGGGGYWGNNNYQRIDCKIVPQEYEVKSNDGYKFNRTVG
jgi:hypothetical protein